MFVPLKITKTEIDGLEQRNGKMLLPRPKEASDAFYKGILRRVTDEHGVIDGSNLQGIVFPFDKANYDVFISYSHNDEAAALYLATYLRSKGLSVFLDSTVWYSADGLLNIIDHKYSMAVDKVHFDYEKRNFSTSRVHAMLSMAILEAIRHSECCLFVMSPHSLTLQSGIETKTLSTWIYEEASFINNIQPSLPPRMVKPTLKMFSEGGSVQIKDSATNKLEAQYNIDLTNFHEVKSLDFEVRTGTAILDYIYAKYEIKKRKLLYG